MNENTDRFEVLSVDAMRKKYYESSESAPRIILNPANVPQQLRGLIPLAERWGIGDDILRSDARSRASREELSELKRIVAIHDDLFDKWLAGPESKSDKPTPEYLAFTTMRMAADGC